MPKPSPALTRPQLAQLARAALDNSGALLDDARLLLTFKRWPRAHVLAILAAEEFGKFYLCVVAGLQLESADAAPWTKFWSKFSDHKPKFAAWYAQYVDEQDWGPVGSAGDEEWLRAWDSRKGKAGNNNRDKQAGLYVDFDLGTTALREPAELFSEGGATQMVQIQGRRDGAIGEVLRRGGDAGDPFEEERLTLA